MLLRFLVKFRVLLFIAILFGLALFHPKVMSSPVSKKVQSSPVSNVETFKADSSSKSSASKSFPSTASSPSIPDVKGVHVPVPLVAEAEPMDKTSPEKIVGSVPFGTNFPLSELRALYLGNMSGKTFDEVNHELIFEPSKKSYPPVRSVPLSKRKRILVTGGAGFVGSHLVDRLMKMGHYVIVIDNFFTGSQRNVQHWMGHPHFELIRHDVIDPYLIEVDQIYHLACPASPPFYQHNPVKTVKTNVMGTINMLGLAKRVKARFLLTSTSEVYGDPEVHPQVETYWGHVNPIGPRASYDEGKRVAETLTYAYEKQDKVDVRVVRIFNTFGPRMNPEDGRVVSNFIMQALKNESLTIYGNGSQTRSFQYVHDLVDGLIQTMESNFTQPINLGNPEERTIQQFAEMVRDRIAPNAEIVHLEGLQDDPQRRRPDITRAQTHIGWNVSFSMEAGISETIEYFRGILQEF